MIYMNKLMKNKLDCETDTIRDLAREIVKCTRNICDCLVYDKDKVINDAKLNFDRIMMMYGDRTGYEIACNEIRMNKLSKDQISLFLTEFDSEITKKFSRKVVIYIQGLENSLELRFHSFRENEKFWLSENLDEYDIPIICYCNIVK